MMKITDVSAQQYKWKRSKAIMNGKHTYSTSSMTTLTIHTDEGITGFAAISAINYKMDYLNNFRELLIGENPLDTEKLWQKMWVPKIVGRRGLSTRFISLIDLALWDLKSKLANLPISKLLGGYRDKIPAYVAGGYYEEGSGLLELAKEMEEYVSWGVKCVKMKVGGLSLKEDALRVKTVREVIGDDINLLVDANCAYTFYDAIRFAEMIEEYHPFFFEEPVAPDDYEGMKRLAQKTTIPIAAGENELTKYGFRDLINQGSVSIINVDACIGGGITEFMKIAAFAQAHHIDISPHGPQEIHAHLLGAIPNALMLEYYPPKFDELRYRVFREPMLLNSDGTVTVPTRPGLCTELILDELKPFQVYG
ncbi:mandelate racemase/muconate lactonizing enzyme family protein [Paenibacillus cremeus]|uniref:Mandelate racemase/muconate lactonizing enzyme family protein n=1 Tax=Paenibacillus cremeus TaxID=2163881 RepID=A0A559K630_9BACL|nr:mandelate racemase/muconate lactonizing enzyme family protein [Paenibacillus cremeus]TVY07563.1 mandelate racemase/muconate lactonizing enzyme family protein [Paenibacillus cremeus]